MGSPTKSNRFKNAVSGLLAVTIVTVAGGCTTGLRNYADSTEEKSSKWVSDAGSEARAGRAKEIANDPLGLRNVFMSEKARDIERNLGFE